MARKIRQREITLFPDQMKALKLATAKWTRHLACCTGFGGGKSLLLAIIGNVWAELPGNYIMIAAPNYPQLKRTIWRSFLEITPEGNICRLNKGDMEMSIDYSNGQEPPAELYFQSAEMDPEKWQGPNLGGALFDEAEGISEQHYKRAKDRLRRVNPETGVAYPNKLVIATNPPPEDHWLSQDFLFNPKKGYQFCEWSMTANFHNPKEFVEDQFQTYTGKDRERFVHGKIGVSFKGKVFDFYKDIHILPFEVAEQIRRQCQYRLYGVDYGWEDPFVCNEYCWWAPWNSWILTREVYESRMSADDRAQAMANFVNLDYDIFGDRNPTDAHELELRGYPIQTAYKSNNYKEAAIEYVNGLMHIQHESRKAGFYISEGCENAALEFNSWRNKIDTRTDRPIEGVYEGADHAIDATIYALYTNYLNHGGEIEDTSGNLKGKRQGIIIPDRLYGYDEELPDLSAPTPYDQYGVNMNPWDSR